MKILWVLDELTFYQSAGTAAACLPAEGTVPISVLPFKVLLSIINLLLLIRYEYTVSIGLLDELPSTSLQALQLHAFLQKEQYSVISVLPFKMVFEYNRSTFVNETWIYCDYWTLWCWVWSRSKCSCTCRTASTYPFKYRIVKKNNCALFIWHYVK